MLLDSDSAVLFKYIFLFKIFKFIFYRDRGRERVREREGRREKKREGRRERARTPLDVPLFMPALVDGSVPDWGQNPRPWQIRTSPTSAGRPGQGGSLPPLFFCLESGALG